MDGDNIVQPSSMIVLHIGSPVDTIAAETRAHLSARGTAGSWIP